MDQAIPNWLAIYLCLGVIWGILILAIYCNNERYSTSRRAVVFIINMVGVGITFPVWLYAKLILKRDTLFEGCIGNNCPIDKKK